jgi:glycosyltransferase involved in cell wall biosynthesis
MFDKSYTPQVVVYPEIFQPQHSAQVFHICFALGRFKPIEPHADLVVVKSSGMFDWVKQQQPQLRVKLIRGGVNRNIFDYDGRPKREIICHMTRPHKNPETAALLRERYGDKVVEIVGKSETETAEILKSAKVFVWRGFETEGFGRPPREALAAGCVVVGLAKDLSAEQDINFGMKCRDVDELLQKAGEALQMPIPSPAERAVVRDSEDEARDWFALMKTLKLPPRR